MKTKISSLLAFVFHPLWMVTYFSILCFIANPILFPYDTFGGNKHLWLILGFSTFFLPAISVWLMKMIGFVDSIQLETKNERIGPIMVTIILYLWTFFTFRHNNGFPEPVKIALLAATIAMSLTFLLNLFTKISLHSIGSMSFLCLVIYLIFRYKVFYWSFPFPFGLSFHVHYVIIIAFCVALVGAVGSLRMYQKAHKLDEILGGYFIGFVSVLFGSIIFSSYFS